MYIHKLTGYLYQFSILFSWLDSLIIVARQPHYRGFKVPLKTHRTQ